MHLLWTVGLVLATIATETIGHGTWGLWNRPLPRWPPTPQERCIIGLCKEDIGRCALRPYGGGDQAPWRCPWRTVPCPEFETVSVNCSGNVFSVMKVTNCTCCRRKDLLIKGVVVDSTDATIKLNDIAVYIRWPIRYRRTDANGEFNMTVPTTTRRVVISAKDRSGTYVGTVKVVDIPKRSKGPISVTIAMVKRATPIVIDASAENTISISSNPGDVAAGNATIKISAGTFRRRDGSVYSGNVKVSLTFIHTADSSVEAEIPGVFLTAWSQPLLTDGIFQLTYRAADGTRLRAKPMLVTVRDNMRLWSLSYYTGRWWPLRDVRWHHQTSQSEFLVLIYDGRWVNMDKIPRSPRCYYKTRVYRESDGTEVTNSPTVTFRPELVAYRAASSQRLRLYAPSTTSSPPAKCFEARCPTNAADMLAGFLSLTSYEDVLVGGVYVPIVQKLRPKQLSLYSTAIQTEHQGVQYEVTFNLEEIFVNFTSSATGPFFTDRATCDNSDDSKPAFYFIKSELPCYVPHPENVEECTARVWFYAKANLVDALDSHGTPIAIAAISKWTQSGNNYVIAYNTTLQPYNNPGEVQVFFACVTYRCSKTNEITTVGIDMDIPMVPGNSGTTEPLFLCLDTPTYNPAAEIEGSFDAPVSVGSGPDYWGSSPNNCNTLSVSDSPPAHLLQCFLDPSELE